MADIPQRQFNANYQTDAADGATEVRLRRLTHSLSERVKELNCLYGISRLFENRRNSLDETLQRVVELIPPAWQYPEITCARISLKNKAFQTANFKETAWRQAQPIIVNGRRSGVLEVYYLEEKPECDDGPFLREERNLLRVLAERLGHAIEREIADKNLESLYQRERETRERLQAEIKIRVDFTRKLIHELKTPLTSLIATSQLLRDETRGERLDRLADYIWDGVNSMNNRIEELHDITRGEMGTLKLSLKPVHIDELLRAVVEETRPLFQQYGIAARLDIPEPLPEVSADPDRIRQIVLNLINNACKYTKEGKKVTIRASRKAHAIAVEVRDWGPGIPAERQSTLFEPAHQLPYSETGTGGLGIGLPLCRMLVELHGGRIWVRSKVGKGSRFFFTIPLDETADQVGETDESSSY